MKKLLLTSLTLFSIFYFGFAQTQQSFPSLNIKKQRENRDEEPRFEMVPDYYAFGYMGPADDGSYNYDSDTATFSVINEGYEDFYMTAEPYFFSGHDDAFECIDTNTYDFLVNGPYSETGTAYEFEVVFEPNTDGVLRSLLVTEDDISRYIRTSYIEGTASYYGYLPGIGENKSSGSHGFSQDWYNDPDYDLAGNFDNYVNDFQLDATATADVVFYINLFGKSEVTFDHFENITDLALFEAGIEVLEENNIYNDEPITLDPGVYYIVVSGNDKFKFKTTVIPEDYPLIIEPEELHLSDAPVDCWHEGGTFEISCQQSFWRTIHDISLKDSSHFELNYDFDLPITIGNEDTLQVNVFADTDSIGYLETELIVIDSDTTHEHLITANTYEPVTGDVFCNPVEVVFDEEGGYTDDNSVAFPMRDNYHLSNGFGDVVYQFTITEECILDVETDNPLMYPIMEVYTENDVSNETPDNLVPVVEGEETISDWQVNPGTYYLVIAGHTAIPDYSITFNQSALPLPDEPMLLSPEDGATDITSSTLLTWQTGAFTDSIEVLLDTQYPPQDVIYADNNQTDSFQVENLEPNQQYFWRVNAHNNSGVNESEIFGFTTVLLPPNFVSAQIFDFINVHLNWEAPENIAHTVAEDFENCTLPEGWTMISAASGENAGWFVTDDGSSESFEIPPHTCYAISNDDLNNGYGSEDYLIMPSQDFSDWSSASLQFASYFTGEYYQSAYVEISTDGGQSFQTIHELDAAEDWKTVEVDLSEYAVPSNTDVRVAFHSDDNGGWGTGWAIDDVELQLNHGFNRERELQGYNVYQNGQQINPEMVNNTEYDVLDLEPGNYAFGVSAIYDEGESVIMETDTLSIYGFGTLEGFVTSENSRTAISGAEIHLTGPWQDEMLDYTTFTDEDGHYSIELPVLPDTSAYTMIVSATGYANDTIQGVQVTHDQSTTVDSELEELILPPEEVTAELNDYESVATINWNSPLGNRELLHYMVYRFHEEYLNNPGEWSLLSDSVTTTSYIDSSFQDLSYGVYRFGVKSVYTDSISEAALSNSLEKGMYSNVIISISTNSGEVVEDAIIELVGYDTTITDTITIPGTFSYFGLPVDMYTVTIYADGYELYLGSIEITEPYFIWDITLYESLFPPENIISSVECDDVHLTWEYQPDSPWGNADRSFSGFNIYRNNELLNASPITDTTFTDVDVPPGLYSYEVTSMYTTGESNGIETLAGIETLLPATNLTAQHHEDSDVFIEWVAPSMATAQAIAADLTGYHLFRASSLGDTVVFELPVTDTYLDENLPVPANEVTYTYWVRALYSGACLTAPSNADAVTFISDNIENPDKEKILVFPNPSRKAFYIELKSKAKQIEIVNSLGQISYQKLNPDTNPVHIAGLTSGVYSLKVVLMDNTVISKMIIVSR